MSVRIMNWAWHDPATQHLRGNAAMALLALADIADDEGNVVYAKGARRSQESLAKKARMSVATFRRVTSDLVEQGFLEVSRESPRSENEYRVIVTAHSERSQVSGQTDEFERSHRSRVSGRTSYRRSDVDDVSLLPDPADLGMREAFDSFYDIYPRKVGRAKAEARFSEAIKKGTPARVIVEAARRYARDPNLPRDRQYIPHPATWLFQGRWADEPQVERREQRTFAQQKQSNTLALVEQLRKEESREEVGSRHAAGLQALA